MSMDPDDIDAVIPKLRRLRKKFSKDLFITDYLSALLYLTKQDDEAVQMAQQALQVRVFYFLIYLFRSTRIIPMLSFELPDQNSEEGK